MNGFWKHFTKRQIFDSKYMGFYKLLSHFAGQHPISFEIIKFLFYSTLVLSSRAVISAWLSDFSRRISFSYMFMSLFGRILDTFSKDPVWSGKWETTWYFSGKSFPSINTSSNILYRCFNSIALKVEYISCDGKKFSYIFLGKLTKDKTILTGIWHDQIGPDRGYYGCYQLRLMDDLSTAEGKWVGFSGKAPIVNADQFMWKKLVWC